MFPKLLNSPRSLYFQVLLAVVAGIALGHYSPLFAVEMKPFGDLFIRLVRMIIAPIIFATVVVGIAKLKHAGDVGRIGLKALVYFEVMSTVALIIGLLVGHFLHPGAGMHVDVTSLDAAALGEFRNTKPFSTWDFLLGIVPSTMIDAFDKGDTLQVLLVSTLLGLALAQLGERTRTVVRMIEELSDGLFRIVGMIMHLAPLGAFGAIAFAVGKYGVAVLAKLGILVLCFYLTSALFIIVGLGLVARASGFSLWQIAKYIREEIFIVLATSSTEPVLPALMAKMERLGCEKSMVGLVLPMGYALNLDGSSIYYTLAVTFIAQSLGIELGWTDLALVLGVLMLTSKGAATVSGGGFVALAATLATIGGKVPVEGMVLILGVDRFMSEARALTNLFGNTVATLFIAQWEGALDRDRARKILAGEEPAALATAA